MKNPFKRFRSAKENPIENQQPQPDITEENTPTEPESEPEKAPEDPFVEWRRSQVRGGIERRERNDIFEAYNVYGTDEKNQLICRHYHRYPEHERDFDLSYERVLSFDELNRRLLAELDKGDIKLDAYNYCITKARQLCDIPAPELADYTGFTESETSSLRAFCEAIDTLTDKEYRTTDGYFCCSCRSVAENQHLNLRFRKPLPHDASFTDIAGVNKKQIEGYEIDSLWILGVYNRLNEQSARCRVNILTSEWSLDKEFVYLIEAEDLSGVDGTLLLAVADEAAFVRFGFYSLDFANK